MNNIEVIRLTRSKLERRHIEGINKLLMQLDPKHTRLDISSIQETATRQYLFVAQLDFRLVGMVVFDWREQLRRRIGEFYGLIVDKDFRGKGIESQLVKRCNQEACDLRLDLLVGLCNPHDNAMRKVAKELRFDTKTTFLSTRPPERTFEKPAQE